MTHKQFYDVKVLQESCGTNFSKDNDRNQVNWHDIKVLRVEKEHPGAFFYKSSFEEETFKKTCVRKRNATNQPFISNNLTGAYRYLNTDNTYLYLCYFSGEPKNCLII